MLTTLALSAIGTAQAGCADTDLDATIEQTERAFADDDRVAAYLGTRRTQRALRCQQAPVPPATIGRVHRASALAWHLRDDPRGVQRALRAMLVADPLLTLPESLVPGDHPLRAAKHLAEETPVRWVPSLRRPALVDGLRTGAIPLGQPYVVQRLRGDRVVGTKLVEPGGGLRHLGMAMAVRNQWSAPARPVWHVGVGLGVGALGLLTTAAVTGIAAGEGAQGLSSVATITGIGGASALVLSVVAIGGSGALEGASPSARRPPP